MEELGQLYILGNHNRLWATSLITNVSKNWFNIGMVLVDPSFRKRGTGSLITKVSMDEVANDDAVISLTSSLEAKRVYRNLDFVEIGSMINMRRLSGIKKPNTGQGGCRKILSADLERIIDLEARFLKIDRSRIVEQWISFARFSVLFESEDQVQGYGCLIERGDGDSRYGVIGPIVANSLETAQAIIASISSAYGNVIEIFLIDCQTQRYTNFSRSDLVMFLEMLGFTKKQTLPIMTWQGAELLPYQAPENWCPVSLALG